MYKYRHDITLKTAGDYNITFYLFTDVENSLNTRGLFDLLYTAQNYSLIFYEVTENEDEFSSSYELKLDYPNNINTEEYLSDGDDTWYKWMACGNSNLGGPLLDWDEEILPEYELLSDTVTTLNEKMYRHDLVITDTDGVDDLTYHICVYSPSSEEYVFGSEETFNRLKSELVLSDIKTRYLENSQFDPQRPDPLINDQRRCLNQLKLSSYIYSDDPESSYTVLLFDQLFIDIDPDTNEIWYTEDDNYSFPIYLGMPLPETFTFTDTVTEV